MPRLSRTWLLVLSVVDCAVGAMALVGPHPERPTMYVINVLLAVILAVATGQDLMARGLRWGWLVGLSYVLAPLVGLILYAIFSAHPARETSTT